ncbi:AI-2E family transporter [Cellulosimicrobium funkei]|nr:AI-2E family transporter [Cellulosimicrobium funkei]
MATDDPRDPDESPEAQSPAPTAASPAVESAGSPPAVSPAPLADHGSTRSKLRAALDALGHPFGFGFVLTLGGLAAILLGAALTSLSTVLVYIVLALFLALALDPAVRFLERRGLQRPWGIAITLLAFLLAIAGVLWLIVPTVVEQITNFVYSIPGMVDDFLASDLYTRLEGSFGEGLGTLTAQVESFLTDPNSLATIGGGALQAGVGIANGLSGALIILVLALYFLASLRSMKRALYRLAPARNRPGVEDLTEEITQSVGAYLAGMAVLALFNAVVVFVLHLVLGLAFPALMAVTAFCITIIPLVGTVLFWVIGSFFAVFVDPASALVFAIAYLVYMQVEAYLLTPRVMSRAISIPGALVVIGALVGGTLLGLIGALIAIPVTAAVLLIIRRVVVPRQDAKT